jgi:hypothetical protein
MKASGVDSDLTFGNRRTAFESKRVKLARARKDSSDVDIDMSEALESRKPRVRVLPATEDEASREWTGKGLSHIRFTELVQSGQKRGRQVTPVRLDLEGRVYEDEPQIEYLGECS